MHEILTLQFGTYASHLSTHFLNLQAATSTQNQRRFAVDDSFVPLLDASHLFRTGYDTHGNVTSYNPRVVIFNRRRDLGLLSSGSVMEQNDVPHLKSRDFVRKQHEALQREGQFASGQYNTEVWVQRRQSNDTTEYNMELNQLPSAEEWNSMLRDTSLIDESLRHESHLPQEMRENPAEWGVHVDFHKWNDMDMQERRRDPMEEDDDDEDRPRDSTGKGENSTSKAHDFLTSTAGDKTHLDKIRTDLQRNVHTWSDFLEPVLHPKSLCPVQSEVAFYNDYDTHTKSLLDDEYMDRVRFFLEECDYVQGFQMLMDANDGWSSVASHMIDNIRDDVGTKKTILAFTCADMTPPDMDELGMMNLSINMAMGMSDLYERADMVVPLTAYNAITAHFPQMHFQDVSPYQTTALLATIFDNATSAFRKFKNNTEMFRVVQDLQPRASHRISALSGSFPAPIYEKQTLFDFYKALGPIHESSFVNTLSPYNRSTFDAAPLAQSVVMRGFSSTLPLYEPSPEESSADAIKQAFNAEEIRNQIQQLMRANTVGTQPRRTTARDMEDSVLGYCNSHQDMLEKYLDQTKTYNTRVDLLEDPVFLSPSYPNVLSSRELTANGYHRRTHDDDESGVVASAPCISQWETTGAIVPYVRRLSKIVRGCQHRTGSVSLGLTRDQLLEKEETLNEVADDYEVDEEY